MDATGNDAARLRAFLEADDGREFVMLNLVKTRPGIVADPDSGEALGGAAGLGRYSRVFVRGLMRRGGHPLFVGRKVGGYKIGRASCRERVCQDVSISVVAVY